MKKYEQIVIFWVHPSLQNFENFTKLIIRASLSVSKDYHTGHWQRLQVFLITYLAALRPQRDHWKRDSLSHPTFTTAHYLVRPGSLVTRLRLQEQLRTSVVFDGIDVLSMQKVMKRCMRNNWKWNRKRLLEDIKHLENQPSSSQYSIL